MNEAGVAPPGVMPSQQPTIVLRNDVTQYFGSSVQVCSTTLRLSLPVTPLKARPSSIVSTVPLRHHSGDSWEGYTFERNEILRFIADRRIANVIFLVGDVHYAALLRHPEGPYEAISGPLAAILSRSSRVAGKPEALWSATGKFNYGWMRIARDGILVEWRDDQDNLMHQARLPITR